MIKNSWIKKLGDYELVMVSGYVGEKQVSMFIRDKEGKTICDLGIMLKSEANWLYNHMELKGVNEQ